MHGATKFLVPFVILLCLAVAAPRTYAQATSLTYVDYPSYVSSLATEFNVTANVAYYPNFGEYPGLAAALVDQSGQSFIQGTVVASPIGCYLTNQTYCLLATQAESGGGNEQFVFNVAQVHPTGVWDILLRTALTDSSGNAIPDTLSQQTLVIHIGIPTLTLKLPDVAVAVVQIDDQTYDTINGTVSATIPGGDHTISVPELLPVNDYTQLKFDKWSDGVIGYERQIDLTGNLTLEAEYITQYQVVASVVLGSEQQGTLNQEWYDAGSTQSFDIAYLPAVSPMQGILGFWGAEWRFRGWYDNGQFLTSSRNVTITINGPHNLVATWTPDYTTPILIIGGLSGTILAVAGGLIILRRRPLPKTRSQTRTKTNFCAHCGAKQPLTAKFCNECGQALGKRT